MAVTVTKEYLAFIAPEFCDMDQRRLDVLNATADCYVSEAVFGDCAMQAKAYVIAHQAKLGDNEGSGPTTSEKVGDLARGSAGPGSNSKDWELTSYGKQFLRLARITAIPITDKFVV